MSAGRLGLRRLPRPPAPRTSPAWQMAMARCRGQSSRLSACPSARLPQGRLQQIQMQSPPACHSGRGSSCQLEPGAACQKRPCSDASKNLSRHTAPSFSSGRTPKAPFSSFQACRRFRTQAGACRHHPSPLPPCALPLGHGAGKRCRSAFRAPKTEEGARPLDARPLPKGRLGKGFRAPLDPDGAFLVPHLDLGCQRRPSGRREGWKAVLRQSGQARQSLQNP